MKILSVIPARMGSSRFQGKPMALIADMPMVGHCYLRAKRSQLATKTVVACCDEIVSQYISSIGGRAVMTQTTHAMCTDRVVEATRKVEKQDRMQYDIIVNIQGDQPLVHPKMIDQVIKPLLKNPSLHVASLMTKINDKKSFYDPNRIKVICDKNKNCLYMSREPIPSLKKGWRFNKINAFVHVALTAFRRDFLFKFGKMKITPLENIEGIDNLRILENNTAISMAITNCRTETVDVPNDIKLVEKLLKKDLLYPTYKDHK